MKNSKRYVLSKKEQPKTAEKPAKIRILSKISVSQFVRLHHSASDSALR